MKTYTLEELKLAQAKKCRIEYLTVGQAGWVTVESPVYDGGIGCYRIHPDDEWKARLPRLREGAEWCCKGNDFPKKHRPHIIGEHVEGTYGFKAQSGFGYSTARPVPPKFLHEDELATQPEATPAPDYGEPWHLTDSDTAHAMTRNDEAALFPVASMKRAVACVNALVGIPDPAAFVAEAKEMQKKISRLEWELAIQRGDIAAAQKIEREGGLK